ncbi:MAG: reverse transcriptase-like protein [Bacteroidales bacterium]|nr:reverse transcriptase-like protein [Bacteroidales bacterium]
MKTNNYILKFTLIYEDQINFTVTNKQEKVSVNYNMKNVNLSFDNQNELSEIIQENQLQLKKILHSALKGKLTPGQFIHFAFIKDFPFINNHDFNHYIQVDRRNNQFNIQVKKKETENIYKLFADGSYAQDIERSGYAGIIEDDRGNRQIFHAFLPVKSSNLMELLAITEGLKRLKHVEKIQVNTDSRFVIRGLAQWIHFWKLNDWHTALGHKVKFARHWQQIDKLSEGKLLELKWIKAHSGDLNHGFCHKMAKQIATKKTLKNLLSNLE